MSASAVLSDPDLLRAFALAQQRRPAEALEVIREALAGCHADRRPLLEHGQKILAWFVAAMDGRFQQGLEEAIVGIALLQECGYRPALTWALTTAGFCMAMAGDVELGLRWTEECIGEASRQGDEAMVHRGLSNRAALLGLLGSFEEATEAFAELTSTLGSEPSPDKSSILNNLAFCHLSLAREWADDPRRSQVQAAQALLHATEALWGLEGPEHVRLRVWSLSNQGGALTILGRHAEAEAAFLEALPDADVNPRNGAVLMVNYALLLITLGRLAEARRWVDGALERAPTEAFDPTLDLVLECQLRLEMASSDADAALLCSQRRLARVQESRRVRVRRAVRHLEIVTQTERAQIEQRERTETEIRATRQRLEETRQSLMRAELETERSRLQERERLLQDMHDGFGSQLVSARMLAEAGMLTATQLVGVLEDCTADLHLVSDTLSEPDGFLEDALADFRFRCERRLGGQPVELDWDIDLGPARRPNHRMNLQILRIVQEALNNALRHARARRIVVRARLEASGGVRIVVVDDGCGMASDTKPGRGLGNMRSRARDMGASLTLEPASPGTAVVLVCPGYSGPP